MESGQRLVEHCRALHSRGPQAKTPGGVTTPGMETCATKTLTVGKLWHGHRLNLFLLSQQRFGKTLGCEIRVGGGGVFKVMQETVLKDTQ
jgi:hypothetical protein